jgi:RNA polymerase sigma-70 factor, ECF subfamily
METVRRGGINQDPDAGLVAATKSGDSHAFEKLVSRYERRVFAVAQRITKNREDAEDVVQETFYKAFLHLDGFQEKSLLSTWLTRIAINQALMVLRRRRGALEVSPESCEDGVNSISEVFVDQSPNPEESCRRREHSELLSKAINRLNPAMRRTILLRDIREHTVEETAQILEMSISAVKSRVSRGRRELSGAVNRALLFASPT